MVALFAVETELPFKAAVACNPAAGVEFTGGDRADEDRPDDKLAGGDQPTRAINKALIASGNTAPVREDTGAPEFCDDRLLLAAAGCCAAVCCSCCAIDCSCDAREALAGAWEAELWGSLMSVITTRGGDCSVTRSDTSAPTGKGCVL